jgi:hypothetical protein
LKKSAIESISEVAMHVFIFIFVGAFELQEYPLHLETTP